MSAATRAIWEWLGAPEWGQLETMARESVLAFIAAEPWIAPQAAPEPAREHRVISSFDPEAP